MNKLGSEFIEDFEKDDTNLFGINFRNILLLWSILSSIALIIAISYFKLPERIYEIYIVVFAMPGVFFGVNADKMINLKGKIHFFFLEKRRVYKTTVKINRKEKESDIQKKA